LAGYFDRGGVHPGFFAQIGQTEQAEKMLREEAGYEAGQSMALGRWLASRGKGDTVLGIFDPDRQRCGSPQILQLCMVAMHQSANPPTEAQVKRVEDWFDRFRRDEPDSLMIQMMYADFLDFARRFDEVEKAYRALLARQDLPDADRGA